MEAPTPQEFDIIDQDFYNEIMAEGAIEEEKRIAREKASNDRLLNLLRKVKGKQWVKDLLRFIDDQNDVFGLLRLSRRPSGDPQKEHGFGEIKQIWVYQSLSCNCGDCWHGTIWIEIKKGRYLEMDYAS